MDQRTRDRAALIIAGLGLIIGLSVILFGRFDPGVRLVRTETYVVVEHVEPRSIAAMYGLEPGMIVIEVHGVSLVQMPQYVDPIAYPTLDPVTGEEPPWAPVIEPAVPTVIERDPALIEQLLMQPATGLVAVRPWTLKESFPDGSGLDPNSFEYVALYDDGVDGIRTRLTTFVLGTVMLLLAFWWLASGRGGEALRSLAGPLSVATGMPFLMEPLDVSWSPALIALSGLLLTAAMVPLAIGLLERVEDAESRRVVGFLIVGCVVAAAVVGATAMVTRPWEGEGFLRWTLLAAIPLIPGLAAAGPIQRASTSPSPTGRLLETTEYAAAGVTPAIALASTGAANGVPLAFWFLIILAAGRFTIRPLVRLATRATLQRDLVVAATEAERARVAADIHDDALQELTLLVHRLDAAGDTEGADIARTVSDRLRAICGDLRLPILDDLGVGPALDWLVLRIEKLAGGEVRLERADGTRPPADVELAFFRVAQEALANAVKHGKPPILVRYATTPGGASLSIDDAGPGIEPEAGKGADRAGHFGLLNMQQRAEAIGAILDVRRWPAGGTHVAIEWRAH
jgi:signal transduction histidine kinase